MWLTIGRFSVVEELDVQQLARVTDSLGTAASELGGFQRTLLLASADGRELLCVSEFTIGASARSYANVVRASSDQIASSYGAKFEDLQLVEQVASHMPGA